MRRHIFIILTALLLCACGDEERFRISGSIDGNPTMNMRVGYYADGAFQSLITAARDGKFEFYGSSPAGTVVEIYDYDNRLLGRTYAANGQELELRLDRNSPHRLHASGNEAAAAWADFLRQAADSLAAGSGNDVIAEYIGNHPDRLESTLILLGDYDAAADPAGADSLMQLIEPAARPAAITDGFNYLLQRLVVASASGPVLPFPYLDRRDSLRTFRPSDSRLSIIAVDNNRSDRGDSIVPMLRHLSSEGGRRLAILEVSVDADTMEWKRSTRRDTATWTQAWGAGGVAARGLDRLGIPAVPYFVVCDSAGVQLHRGRSAGEAEAFVMSHLNR